MPTTCQSRSRQLAHLRTENYEWRECVAGIPHDARVHRQSADALCASVDARIHQLGEQVARVYIHHDRH